MNFPIDRVSIRELLIDELKKQFGDNQLIFQSGLLGYWINSMSILAENDLFYTLSAMNESFLSRAIQPTSIVEHAKSLGYKISLATPSSGYVQLFIPLKEFKKFKIDLNINQLQFKTSKEIVYICPYAIQLLIDLDKGINNCYLIDFIGNKKNVTVFLNNVILKGKEEFCAYFSIPVIQSNVVQKIYTISDQDTKVGKNPIIEIPLSLSEGESVGDINVYVNGIKYTQFSFLFEMGPTDLGYVVEYEFNKVNIILGNNVFGYRPKTGSTVLIEVNLTLGANGNVDQNSLNLVTPLVDIFTNKNLEVIINHPPILNGIDGDDYNKIRLNTIRSLRNGSIYNEITKTFHRRLVTQQDYIDLINLSYSNVFDSAVPVVKRSDSFSNNIILYLTPKVNDVKNGYRPLKCTSGVCGPINISETTILFAQGQNISASPFSIYSSKEGYLLKDYISLFEIKFIKEINNSYIAYNYINYDFNILLNIISQSKHSVDYFTEIKTNNIKVKYFNKKYLLEVDLYFTTTDDLTEIQEPTSNLFEIYNTLPSFNLDNFKFEMLLKDLKLNEIKIINFNDWKIVSISKKENQYIIKLAYLIDSNQIKENNYQITIDCTVKVNDDVENLFKAYATNIYFKYDFTGLFPLTYEVDENGNYFVYNIPLVEMNDYFEFFTYLNQVFIPTLIELKKEISLSKMLTTDISIAFTKTYGYINNIKYNSYNSMAVYKYDNSFINYFSLPLKFLVNVIPDRKAEDINLLIQQIKDILFNFLYTKRGIHSSIFLPELVSEVLKIPNIYDVTIDLFGANEDSNIPLNFDFDEQHHIPPEEIKSFVPEYVWLLSKDDIIVQIQKTKVIK